MERPAALFLGLLLAAVPAAGKDFWQNSYQRWSKDQCEQMLHESPWSKRMTFGHPVLTSTASGYSPEMVEEATPEVTYFIQLRSAQPVRQALVREQQIEQKYDHLSDVQKKSFDGAAEKFLTEAFPQAMVVHVEYTANAPLFLRSLENSWQTVDTRFAQQSMFLIVPGEGKIAPLKLLVGKGDSRAFEIIFPRMLNGHPLLTSDLKNFAIEFQAPSPVAVRSSAATPATFNTRVYVEFKPSKMMFDSKFEY